MKKIISFLMMLVLLVTLSACSDDVGNNFKKTERSDNVDEYYSDDDYQFDDDYQNDSEDKAMTVMDMFDGKRKVWFLVFKGNVLRHDSEVHLVLVTKNKKVENVYYKARYKNFVDEQPDIYGEKYVLSDFDGLSDDEIIEMVKDSYADISKNYSYTVGENEISVPAQRTPFTISYEGYLDNSGNYLKREVLSLFEQKIEYYPYNSFEPDFLIDEFIYPTTVKNKEYVGFLCVGSNKALITANTSKSFDVEFDNPDGATKTY